MDNVSNIWGAVQFAYVASSVYPNDLYIVDVSDYNNPRIAAFIPTGYTNLAGVSIHDGMLYVCGYDGLSVFDVANPLQPILLSRIELVNCRSLFVNGNTAFIGHWPPGFYAIDITELTNPSLVGNVVTSNVPRSFCVYDDVLWVINESLTTYDISDLENPVMISSGPSSLHGTEILRVGHYGLVSQSQGLWLYTYDLNQPESLVAIDTTYFGGSILKFAVGEEIGAVTTNDDNIYVFNLENLPQLEVFDSSSVPRRSHGLAIDNQHVLATFFYDGLRIYETSGGETIDLVGAYSHVGTPTGVRLAPPHAFVQASTGEFLFSVDIHDLSSPQIMSSLGDLFASEGMAMSGDVIAMTGGCNGMILVDVSNPDSMMVLNEQYEVAGCPASIALTTSYAFMLDYGDNDLYAFSVAEPETPNFLGTFEVGNPDYLPVCAKDSCAYVKLSNRTIGVVCIENGAFEVTDSITHDGSGWLSEFVVHGDRLYCSYSPGPFSDDYSLEIYDVLEPRNPQLVSTTAVSVLGVKLAATDTLLIYRNWSYNREDELFIVDVSDAEHPHQLIHDTLESDIRSLDIVGNLIAAVEHQEIVFYELVDETAFVSSGGREVPSDLRIAAFPNPFNPVTTIRFTVARAGVVIVDVFDVTGRQVFELFREYVSPGSHEVELDGSSLPSGIYFAKLEVGASSLTTKMVLLK